MKKMFLSNGEVTLVDDEDFAYLSNWMWRRDRMGYAIRTTRIKGTKRIKTIKMHRIINKTPDGMDTDHMDGNKLNNQKANLRSCTRSQNCQNARGRIKGTSKYMGVYWNKRDSKWRAAITVNYKKIVLGSYNSEHDAALAYNRGAIKYHGKNAYQNEVRIDANK